MDLSASSAREAGVGGGRGTLNSAGARSGGLSDCVLKFLGAGRPKPWGLGSLLLVKSVSAVRGKPTGEGLGEFKGIRAHSFLLGALSRMSRGFNRAPSHVGRLCSGWEQGASTYDPFRLGTQDVRFHITIWAPNKQYGNPTPLNLKP